MGLIELLVYIVVVVLVGWLAIWVLGQLAPGHPAVIDKIIWVVVVPDHCAGLGARLRHCGPAGAAVARMTPLPLTPAQIEWLEHWLEAREQRVSADVDARIAAAVAPLQGRLDALTAQVATLQEALAVLDGAAVKVGAAIALRAHSGHTLSAVGGGAKADQQPITFVGQSVIAEWESFTVERGAR